MVRYMACAAWFWSMVYGIEYMVHEHEVSTNHGFWNPAFLGLWNQDVDAYVYAVFRGPR